MNLILTLVFLVVLAVLGKYVFPKIPLNNLLQNFLNFSGFYYLLLGILLGPYVLNIFTQQVIEQSYFVFSLVLGWTGFLIGLQLNFKQIRRFQKTYYFNALLYFLLNLFLIMGLLSIANYLIFNKLTFLERLLLAVAGSISSTITIGLLARTKQFSTREGHFLEFLAAFDNVLGVLALGVLFAVFQFLNRQSETDLIILVSAYFIVIFFSLIYKHLSRELQSFEAQMLVILSIILIIVAISEILQNSVLFLSAILGMTIANLKGVNIKKLYLLVQEWEKPLNFILLFFIGVVLQIKAVFVLTALFLFIVVIANLITERIVLKKFSEKMGFQTFGLSTVSLAIMLDAYLSGAKIELVSAIVITYFLTNIFSIYYIKKNRMIAE